MKLAWCGVTQERDSGLLWEVHEKMPMLSEFPLTADISDDRA